MKEGFYWVLLEGETKKTIGYYSGKNGNLEYWDIIGAQDYEKPKFKIFKEVKENSK